MEDWDLFPGSTSKNASVSLASTGVQWVEDEFSRGEGLVDWVSISPGTYSIGTDP